MPKLRLKDREQKSLPSAHLSFNSAQYTGGSTSSQRGQGRVIMPDKGAGPPEQREVGRWTGGGARRCVLPGVPVDNAEFFSIHGVTHPSTIRAGIRMWVRWARIRFCLYLKLWYFVLSRIFAFILILKNVTYFDYWVFAPQRDLHVSFQSWPVIYVQPL